MMAPYDFLLLMIAPAGAAVIGIIIGIMSWREREQQRIRRVAPGSPGVFFRHSYAEPPPATDLKPANVNAGEFHTEKKLSYPEAHLAP